MKKQTINKPLNAITNKYQLIQTQGLGATYAVPNKEVKELHDNNKPLSTAYMIGEQNVWKADIIQETSDKQLLEHITEHLQGTYESKPQHKETQGPASPLTTHPFTTRQAPSAIDLYYKENKQEPASEYDTKTV